MSPIWMTRKGSQVICEATTWEALIFQALSSRRCSGAPGRARKGVRTAPLEAAFRLVFSSTPEP